ncbi:DUF116 domain-containing protein [Clostridium pasteurianum]|uniref:DUF116 domain-containing protein n=1 Tax=Clostridium pasteurianum BC1 TaxID=86416 RepID=R4K9B7_CLOPA|nr:DUF116 domain-containing protein [Clostridium pasteurianum]AGK98296.1 hypothetical protein Clopa_3508 [Clostridium pasteurianum BC1]
MGNIDIVTYSLLGQHIDSNEYYVDSEAFTNEVILNGKPIMNSIILDFKNYIKENNIESLRSNEEYLLELLTLAILWQLYSDDAFELSELPKRIIKKLVELRKQGGNIKAGVDFIRGILSTIFLSPNSNYKSTINLSLKNFKRFISWLSASGEFDEEVKRFVSWEKYFSTLELKKLDEIFLATAAYVLWFSARSEVAIGKYTRNVNYFLKNKYPKHKFKEDIILCGRQRVEYHLNMVGAEIMNRAFRNDFLKTRIKKLLLPICMRYNNEKNCKAKHTEEGYVCGSCTAECRVSKLTEMGEKHRFEVLIIPHGSSAFREEKVKYGEIGIVGVDCVLNLMSGGWKARDLNLVPQCVILDYCGCKNHWSNEGIVTDINIDQLKKVLDIN